MEVLFSNIYNAKSGGQDIEYPNIDFDYLLKMESFEERHQLLTNMEDKLESMPPTVEMAAIANFYCKKHGFTTTFFGDEKSLELHKNIKFDNFKLIPNDFISSQPKYFWSVGKLYALRKTNNPCIHIDSDLFLIKTLPEDYLQQDIVCFHNEEFVQEDFDEMQGLFGINPEGCNEIPNISYNCGVMGGQDFKSWHKAIDILFDFMDRNEKYITEICNKYSDKDFFYPPVLFEQIWLFKILKTMGKKITDLVKVTSWQAQDYFQEIKQYGYIHLMSNKLLHQNNCKKIIEKYNIKC